MAKREECRLQKNHQRMYVSACHCLRLIKKERNSNHFAGERPTTNSTRAHLAHLWRARLAVVHGGMFRDDVLTTRKEFRQPFHDDDTSSD